VINQGSRILITGASGFIGSHLTGKLLALGAEVWAVSRSITGKVATPHLHWLQADLSQPSAIDTLLEDAQPDVIFHLAGQATGSRDLEAVIPTFEANLTSAVYLLTAATKRKCKKVVLAGSGEEPRGNTADPPLSSPYAAAKWAVSRYTSLFFDLYRTPVVNARVYMVYGPGEQNLNKIVPYTILSLLKGQPPKMSSGERFCDWIHVEDVAEGLLACARAEGAVGKTVDIGSGTLVSVREMVEIVAALLEVKVDLHFGSLTDRPLDTHMPRAQLKRTQTTLAWLPRITLDRGLPLTVKWFVERFQTHGFQALLTCWAYQSELPESLLQSFRAL
jgi:UDP-glucose 4-epimerase